MRDERPRTERAPIGFDGDGARAIRSQDANRSALEHVDRLRSWMAEKISCADGDDADSWCDGVEKIGRGSVRTAVMTDLEHVGAQSLILCMSLLWGRRVRSSNRFLVDTADDPKSMSRISFSSINRICFARVGSARRLNSIADARP